MSRELRTIIRTVVAVLTAALIPLCEGSWSGGEDGTTPCSGTGDYRCDVFIPDPATTSFDIEDESTYCGSTNDCGSESGVYEYSVSSNTLTLDGLKNRNFYIYVQDTVRVTESMCGIAGRDDDYL